MNLPNNPNHDSNNRDEEGKKSEGETQEPTKRPTLTIALAAHA
jgi:hypothetical protein